MSPKKGQDQPVDESAAVDSIPRLGETRLGRLPPWLTFLLPFAVYMIVGSFEPAAPKPATVLPDGTSRPAINQNWFGLEYHQYPIVYTVKIALTIAAMLFVLPGYGQFPCRVSLLAIAIGVVGVILWIAICHLQLERKLLAPLGLEKFLGL